MSVKIRLSRHGAKKSPFYRIVVSDSRAPRDGRYIEQVGTYNPRVDTGGIKINSEKIERWLQRGAQPTQIVSDLIKKAARTSQPSLPS
ncbi:MAG: 30S ribosomal protein S16 [Deltaproteobacteria bacterium]|jgi:small subunit ribosomal protein S16|nr:30S ribosomal protein S16 [Deltaproteobacteria bacterium]MCZ6547528.1 30S ribosomal protein S16 [Deltaproteobacteria bacterium]